MKVLVIIWLFLSGHDRKRCYRPVPRVFREPVNDSQVGTHLSVSKRGSDEKQSEATCSSDMTIAFPVRSSSFRFGRPPRESFSSASIEFPLRFSHVMVEEERGGTRSRRLSLASRVVTPDQSAAGSTVSCRARQSTAVPEHLQISHTAVKAYRRQMTAVRKNNLASLHCDVSSMHLCAGIQRGE